MRERPQPNNNFTKRSRREMIVFCCSLLIFSLISFYSSFRDDDDDDRVDSPHTLTHTNHMQTLHTVFIVLLSHSGALTLWSFHHLSVALTRCVVVVFSPIRMRNALELCGMEMQLDSSSGWFVLESDYCLRGWGIEASKSIGCPPGRQTTKCIKQGAKTMNTTRGSGHGAERDGKP